jgi:hypothetical protein
MENRLNRRKAWREGQLGIPEGVRAMSSDNLNVSDAGGGGGLPPRREVNYRKKVAVPSGADADEATIPVTSAEVRSRLVETLQLDLVGPDNDHPCAAELLPQSPQRWYLTGYLVPQRAPEPSRRSRDEEDEGEGAVEQGGDEDQHADSNARVSYLPSSVGLSVLIPPGVPGLRAVVRWGDYEWEASDRVAEGEDGGEVDEEAENERFERQMAQESEPPADHAGTGEPKAEEAPSKEYALRGFRRRSREEACELAIGEGDGTRETELPGSGGVKLVWSWRCLPKGRFVELPDGTRTVSVFVLNDRTCRDGKLTYRDIICQVVLELECREGFLGRPDLRGLVFTDEVDLDERVADLHYRDVLEYASGHGVAAAPPVLADGRCHAVRSTWIPVGEVPRVDHLSLPGIDLTMEGLGEIGSADEARERLDPLVRQYREWIAVQERKMAGESLHAARQETARHLVAAARVAADRIESGILLLRDDQCLKAFCLANRAMARAARQRFAVQEGRQPKEVAAPAWRAFQLAFILMNLDGLFDPGHDDRAKVDLLFFPTGGGKTEAYLGLAAFSLCLRRLQHPGLASAGVSIIMRYTLRLLTLDQLGRAAALMCALELERAREPALGSWPFEIGLWVGSAATPNRMGRKGDTSPGADTTAYTKLQQYLANPGKRPSPIPLEECPWCSTRFEPASFQLDPPGSATPDDLRVACMNMNCEFSGASNRNLPVLGVDEAIYRRLPCFLIATVDKFAALPWVGKTGALFGNVQRHDSRGFYGPCDPSRGQPLPGNRLLPPDLIIQDELHLISGPLGTVAGIYETAIEYLCRRILPDGRTALPKIVASTATVRRADRQIRALFGRQDNAIFPPPGPDRNDSFFAHTVPVSPENPGRLYLGISAQGRSMKVSYLRSCLALLSGARSLYEAAGRDIPGNPADPYMTLLAYFNSLRELGGSRRIVEDEITARLRIYWKRRRRQPEERRFVSRTIRRSPVELTSRVSTDEVAAARRQLALSIASPERVDFALATNMISVGLDIVRLGLMVVYGQPKTSSEYIQATSRVGRDRNRPGLVVVLLNAHRPRDRSHFERFGIYHQTFYRSVEATSVTPFSPRALDRALAAALVGLCRHAVAAIESGNAAGLAGQHHQELISMAAVFGERARIHDADKAATQEGEELQASVQSRAEALISAWFEISRMSASEGTGLSYQKFEDKPQGDTLLRDFLDPELADKLPVFAKFRANRSMREVEPAVDIICRPSTSGTNQ